MRTMVDERDSVEQSLPTITTELGKLGRRNIEVTLFKEGTSKSEFTTQNDALFFTINGQTHATIGRSFLRTKAKLYYLADHLLVHVDCTDVETNIREQTFMPNRERMPRDEITKEVEEILADELGKHEGLKKLNQLRREQQVIKNPKDTEFLEGVVSNLIKNNRSLIDYLGLGGGVKDVTGPGPTIIDKYEGKRFPTYLRIQSFSSKDKLYRKQIPINSYARLKLETDSANDYFDRASENGELKMTPDIMSSFYLWNGIITIKLVPPEDARVGGFQKVVVELTRPYDNSLFVEFEVEYARPIETGINPTGEQNKDKGQAYKLPETTLVYKEKRDGCACWADHDWTGEDVAKVVPGPSGETNGNGKNLDVYINMDANVLHDYLRRQQTSERQQELIKKSWEASIFLNSLVLHNDLSKLEKEDLIPDIMKSTSKITLDLMRNESLLNELEKD